MKQQKICLLGAFSVGKTSLIQRYVSSIFGEKYLTTLGVKVDKKILTVNGEQIMMLIWDMAGEDDYGTLQANYLRGSAGYILVADGTRPRSLDTVHNIDARARELLGDIPRVLALNKIDLTDQWSLTDEAVNELQQEFTTLLTSARTGENVDALFLALGEAMA